jgi:hypothetical protein
MMYDQNPIRRPNPLHPDLMTPAERRTELCTILARGVTSVKVV